MYARECVGSLWRVQGACASQGHFLLSTRQPHLWLISYTLRQLLCARASSFPPEYDKKDKMISKSKLLISASQFSVSAVISVTPCLHLSPSLQHPPSRIFVVSSLCFLASSFSICPSQLFSSVITPPPPPYHHHHHHASPLTLSLSFMPFLLPSIFTQTCERVSSSSFHQKQFN